VRVDNTLEAISLGAPPRDSIVAGPITFFFAHGVLDECCGSPHPCWTFDALAADPLPSITHYRANPLPLPIHTGPNPLSRE
jgi:hypothetical protein